MRIMKHSPNGLFICDTDVNRLGFGSTATLAYSCILD